MSSLAVRVVPCLDVDAGRVVKGVRFADIRDAGDPVELAAEYNRQGADEVVFYDITASAEGRDLILDVASRAAEQLFIPLSIGGGVRSTADIRRLLAAGADKVSVNSAAVARPALIAEGAEAFGTQCIVLSIDCLRVAPGTARWEVVTAGGRNRTGRDVLAWAREGERLGAGELVLNSIDADGTRAGYDLELTRTVADAVDVPVVASGGVGTLAHLVDGVRRGHASAVLAASIFHFGEHTIGDAKDALERAGLTVRR